MEFIKFTKTPNYICLTCSYTQLSTLCNKLDNTTKLNYLNFAM